MINIHFAECIPWAQRDSLPVEPGIYCIRKSDQIIYFGKTWGEGGLRERIRDFNRSAITGKKGHAGGVTYHGMFGSDVGDLAVEVHVPCAINRDPSVLYAYIQYVERRLIWEYVERYGGMPSCNSE